jgi:hypothetical protein
LNANWSIGLIKAEEAPSAILLAHAALLYACKQARRKAALWYFFAAKRLEKCGIVSLYCSVHMPISDESKKSLTMYFLHRAHELHKKQPVKNLSPSFWDSEGLAEADRAGLDTVLSGIEHPLGKGNVAFQILFPLTSGRSITVYYWECGWCCPVIPWFASGIVSTITSFSPPDKWRCGNKDTKSRWNLPGRFSCRFYSTFSPNASVIALR